MKTWLRVCMLSGLLIFATQSPALAENEASTLPNTPVKISERHAPVSVEHEGVDSIGARLSTRLKELFNSSNLFKLEDSDIPKFRVLISTVPEFADRPGVGSAYSIVYVFSQSENTLRHYLARDVGVLTPDEVNDLAAKIIERTDGLAVRYGYLFPETKAE